MFCGSEKKIEMVAENIKALRLASGLSQKEVVGHIEGVSRQQLSHYETGRSQPDLETLCKMADFWGVSLDFLVRGKDFSGNFRDAPKSKVQLISLQVNRLEEVIDGIKVLLNKEEESIWWNLGSS